MEESLDEFVCGGDDRASADLLGKRNFASNLPLISSEQLAGAVSFCEDPMVIEDNELLRISFRSHSNDDG